MTPALVLIGALALILTVLRARPWLALGLTMGTPLFFRLSGEGVDFAASVLDPQPGVTLPLSAFAAPLFAGLAISHPTAWRASGPKSVDRLVVTFLCWALLVFGVGLATGSDTKPLILAQVVGPVFFYVIGRQVENDDALRDLLRGLVAGAAVTCVILALSAILVPRNPLYGTRLGDELIGGLILYQAFDYFPLLLVIAFCAACALLVDRPGLMTLCAAALMVGGVLGLYARGGVITLLASTAFMALAFRRHLPQAARNAGAALAGVVVVLSLALGLSSTERLFETLTGSVRDESTTVRTESARAAGEVIAEDPLVGAAFGASEIDPGTDLARTVRAHNQYLDYAVRAGIPLAIVFILILAAALKHILPDALRGGGGAATIAMVAALSATILISNLVQVNFVQPLTAFPLWLMVGIIATRRSWLRRGPAAVCLRSDHSRAGASSAVGHSELPQNGRRWERTSGLNSAHPTPQHGGRDHE